jgi:hypothetical protein
MKAYAQKQPQQQSSPNLTRSSAQPLAASQAVHPLIQLQRTIGNQAVQRLLRANGQHDDDPVVITKSPSPKALMLLDMFIKNRASFKGASESAFGTEAKDKDASVESIQVKDGEIYWTLKFVTNNKTGVIYVRQSQDGTGIVNWHQGVLSEKAAPSEECAKKAWVKEFDFFSKMKPTPSGSIESSFEKKDLIQMVKLIEARNCPPKEIQVSVTLFNKIGGTVPSDNIAVKNLGFNFKEFLEARLPKSIKIIEVHEVLDLGETSTEYPLQTKVTLVY